MKTRAQRFREPDDGLSSSVLNWLPRFLDYYTLSGPRALVIVGRQGTGKRLPLHLFLSFNDQIEFVSGHVTKYLMLATRPAHLNFIGASVMAEPEMGAKIALRKIAASTGDLTDL